MHIGLAVLILGAIVLGINVLTILVNHLLTRGDVHERLKALKGNAVTAYLLQQKQMNTPDSE